MVNLLAGYLWQPSHVRRQFGNCTEENATPKLSLPRFSHRKLSICGPWMSRAHEPWHCLRRNGNSRPIRTVNRIWKFINFISISSRVCHWQPYQWRRRRRQRKLNKPSSFTAVNWLVRNACEWRVYGHFLITTNASHEHLPRNALRNSNRIFCTTVGLSSYVMQISYGLPALGRNRVRHAMLCRASIRHSCNAVW